METKPAFVLACDIDRTLIAGTYTPEEIAENEEANRSLNALHDEIIRIKHSPDFHFFFGTATGRTPVSHEEAQENEAFDAIMSQADFRITSVGSRIDIRNHYGEFESLSDWPQAPSWDSIAIKKTLDAQPELDPQDASAQDAYKISYDVYGVDDSYHEHYTTDIKEKLGRIGITAQVIFSGGRYLDILPPNTNKGTSLHHLKHHLMARYALSHVTTIGAGDSMNDADLLAAADVAILPENADKTLRIWTSHHLSEKLYPAHARFAGGVLEGLRAALPS